MVAYSFKPRFVAPIQYGLGVLPADQLIERPTISSKRQTIRADRRRHARPGEELQLYCGMRTKGCFLIGRARCTSIEPIGFIVRDDRLMFDYASAPRGSGGRRSVWDEFAHSDGFADAVEMHDFWRAEHGLGVWRGVIIRWEPLP